MMFLNAGLGGKDGGWRRKSDNVNVHRAAAKKHCFKKRAVRDFGSSHCYPTYLVWCTLKL